MKIFTASDIGREVRIAECEQSYAQWLGQFGRVVTAQGALHGVLGLVLVRLDSGAEVWFEHSDLESGAMVSRWEPEAK